MLVKLYPTEGQTRYVNAPSEEDFPSFVKELVDGDYYMVTLTNGETGFMNRKQDEDLLEWNLKVECFVPHTMNKKTKSILGNVVAIEKKI